MPREHAFFILVSAAAAMTLPNFIVIGPGKTGTTWLYRCLREHPQVRLARHTKETVFFTDYYTRGLEWYESFFRECEGATAIGEVSNTYFFSAEAAARIAAHLPDVKLIAFLRHPVDRLVSYYLFQRRNGRMTLSLDEAIAADPDFVTQNFFDDHIEPYLSRFRRDRVFVALHDDLVRDAPTLLRDIYRFLEVDSDFVPPSLNKRALTARVARSASLNRVLKRLALWLRRNDLHRFLSLTKNSSFGAKLLTRRLSDDDVSVLSPQTRARMLALYRPHMERTALLIGRDLSAWM
jgi:hypothetical protein